MNTDEVVFPPCAISTYNVHIPDEGPRGVSGLVPNISPLIEKKNVYNNNNITNKYSNERFKRRKRMNNW